MRGPYKGAPGFDGKTSEKWPAPVGAGHAQPVIEDGHPTVVDRACLDYI